MRRFLNETLQTPDPSDYTNTDLAIGGDWRDRITVKNGKYFNGDIGQVAIYNRVLSNSEMRNNYNSTISNYA